MDLSKLSDEDLKAVASGDFSKVSDEGLKVIAAPSSETASGPLGGVAKMLPGYDKLSQTMGKNDAESGNVVANTPNPLPGVSWGMDRLNGAVTPPNVLAEAAADGGRAVAPAVGKAVEAVNHPRNTLDALAAWLKGVKPNPESAAILPQSAEVLANKAANAGWTFPVRPR
jgi:hypothetical protein